MRMLGCSYDRTLRWAGSAAVLALMLGAGGAHAQVCGEIDDQPFGVFNEFVDVLSGFFFDENEAMCEKMVKAAVAACHKAVSDAASCQSSLVGSILKGAKAGCATEGSEQSSCNAAFKGGAEAARDEIEFEAAESHVLCDGAFAGELSAVCLGGLSL